jgi:hypothetical protein
VPSSFQATLAEALSDLALRGYISQEQIEFWVNRLSQAAGYDIGPEAAIDLLIQRAMGAAKGRLEKNIANRVPGVSRYTLSMVAPHLRAELDRRILASAQLIKLRRKEAIGETLRRFQGWSTSIPLGGDRTVDRRKAKQQIAKPLRSLPFEQRRVLIDQGFKLISNVADIVATDAGAIAGIWHSHWRQPGYDYRKDHKERDERVYAVRDSWAIKAGLMNKGSGYTDEITKPAVEPMCRCFYQYVTALRDLPDSMLTRKGQEELARVRGELAA